MTLKKIDSGWQVDIQPGGRGEKRFRKTFATQAEAKLWESWIRTKVTTQKEWQPEKKDLRKLSDLIDIWYVHHGCNLKASENTYSRLKLACNSMGNPIAEKFNAEIFATYRKNRLESGIKPNSVNREHAYLRSVFNELVRLGQWKKKNPLADVRQIKVDESELSYLTSQEISNLLSSLKSGSNRHALLVTKICLSTGARWSEAEGLEIQNILDGRVSYFGTKSGKSRSLPINQDLENKIRKHHNPRETGNRLFTSCYSAFREAVVRANIKLQPGQLTHVLRHTFASHFMMNGGNILVLQRSLGHANLTMTMRYAHLSPEHLLEVTKLNPLASI